MKKIIASTFLFLLYSEISIGIGAQEIETYLDKKPTEKNETITCPMFNKSCEKIINIGNEVVEDFSNLEKMPRIKQFNLLKAIECQRENLEYAELSNATMCISIEPILIGAILVKITNRLTNSIINIYIYIIKPQISNIETSKWILLCISAIQSIIVASFLDIKEFLSTFKSICKFKSIGKLIGFLIVIFIRTIALLIVSLNFYSEKEDVI